MEAPPSSSVPKPQLQQQQSGTFWGPPESFRETLSLWTELLFSVLLPLHCAVHLFCLLRRYFLPEMARALFLNQWGATFFWGLTYYVCLIACVSLMFHPWIIFLCQVVFFAGCTGFMLQLQW